MAAITAEERAAIRAISAFKLVSAEQEQAQSRAQEILSSSVAVVDIDELFRLFDTLYFRSLLHRRVEVSWSKKMTVSAGLCELIRDPNDDDRFNQIIIKLSEPLLKNRSRSDTIKTLLHESIHAYLFVTTSWRHARRNDGTGHGKGFMTLANAINAHGGYGVTEEHNFHDEVERFQRHVWQCDGPCKTQPPSFGIVRHAINRPPGKFDTWYMQHQKDCGGEFVKIAEPEAKVKKLKSLEKAGTQSNKLDSWISEQVSKRLGTDDAKLDALAIQPKRRCSSDGDDDSVKKIKGAEAAAVVACPICEKDVLENEINKHLDLKHSP